MKRRAQFLFLVVFYRMSVPSIIQSLTGNFPASCRDPEEIIWSWKEALTLEFLNQLKRVLHHRNLYKFKDLRTADECKKSRACGNRASFSKNLSKVEKSMSDEEYNKCLVVLPLWLEWFFPDSHLTTQFLMCKELNNDHLVFDRLFLEAPLSMCINKFASTKDELELHYGSTMTRLLVQACIIRALCPDKCILMFDDNSSGSFCHVQICP